MANERRELLRAAAAAEKRLLADEAKAERKVMRERERLAATDEELRKARERFERRHQALVAAETALRDAQQRRMRGPSLDLGAGTAEPTAPAVSSTGVPAASA
jgi:hypothetical protein